MKLLVQVCLIPAMVFIALITVSYGTDARIDYLPVDKLIKLEKLVGTKVVLLNVWATWCGPCLEELPVLDSLALQIGNEKVAIIAYALVDSSTKSQYQYNDFIKKHSNYKSIFWSRSWGVDDIDLLGADLAKTNLRTDNHGIPITYLIKDNRIQKVYFGFTDPHIKEMEHDARALLAEH